MGFGIKIRRACYPCWRYHRICIPLKGKMAKHRYMTLSTFFAPWSSFVILPLFAFANAGVSFDGIDLSMLTSPLLLAISLGLIIGKPLGVIWFQLSFR